MELCCSLSRFGPLCRTDTVSIVTQGARLGATPCPFAELDNLDRCEAMTLTVVVGPAAGRNCGLPHPLLEQPPIRSLGDRPHTLSLLRAQDYCSRVLLRASYSKPPTHTWHAGVAYDRRIACRGSLSPREPLYTCTLGRPVSAPQAQAAVARRRS